MHRITKTEKPSYTQIEYMEDNLCEKFKMDVSIQAISFKFFPDRRIAKFWLNVKYVFSGYLDTWDELLAKYKELMEKSERP
ncbi:MAG: hypothetical protein JRJ39_00475 [Deltaproteobacteria bacterium]|nr:hypothetical protein [Deltaproteobacteria bacterium]MBW1845584.1 hypothetical protein [Deltaproteobacteria bacterium]MBW2032012.1 hypothetical protein [Deltaproteobacteria bacterium]